MTTAEPTGREPVEHFVARNITYVLEREGRLLVIEKVLLGNVPARVSEETGEQLFSPETAERIQQTAWAEKKPARVLETPVYDAA